MKPSPVSSQPALVIPNVIMVKSDQPHESKQEITIRIENRKIEFFTKDDVVIYSYKLPITMFLNTIYKSSYGPNEDQLVLCGIRDYSLYFRSDLKYEREEYFHRDSIIQAKIITTYISESTSILLADQSFVSASMNFFSTYCQTSFSDILFLQTLFDILLLSEKTMHLAHPLVVTLGQLSIYKDDTAIRNFVNFEFRNFVKLTQEKCPDFTRYTTFIYLLEIAKIFFADQWTQDYNSVFSPLKDSTYDVWLHVFCAIPEIDPYESATQTTFYFFMLHEGKKITDKPFFDDFSTYFGMLKKELDTKQFNNFRVKITAPKKESLGSSIDDIDLMTGEEFEHFIAELFAKMGYSTKVTKLSGDQGIDVIAEKDGKSLGIQAKCYTGSVGNSAIQEAAAGKAYYKLDKVLVITNNYFTESARQLANSNNVILWDRTLLKEKLS